MATCGSLNGEVTTSAGSLLKARLPSLRFPPPMPIPRILPQDQMATCGLASTMAIKSARLRQQGRSLSIPCPMAAGHSASPWGQITTSGLPSTRWAHTRSGRLPYRGRSPSTPSSIPIGSVPRAVWPNPTASRLARMAISGLPSRENGAASAS